MCSSGARRLAPRPPGGTRHPLLVQALGARGSVWGCSPFLEGCAGENEALGSWQQREGVGVSGGHTPSVRGFLPRTLQCPVRAPKEEGVGVASVEAPLEVWYGDWDMHGWVWSSSIRLAERWEQHHRT